MPKDTLAFLRAVYPDGPWCCTAIAVDKKGMETQTFMPSSADDIKRFTKWLNHHNGKSNCYWHVNPVIRPVAKKAEREDIDRVCYLHVDVDPAPASTPEALAREQSKIKDLLSNPPSPVPPPTFLIFSGGGYQSFWKLAEPIPIGGDLVKAEEAALYNKQLEIIFSADHCHNIDRLMRLPGTWNLPDEKKRKKGRERIQAEVVFFEKERVYPLSSFLPAPSVQSEGSSFNTGKTVDIPTNLPRLGSIDELNEWNVPERIKIIVVQGHLPDDPKERDNSRSAWLFDGICGLVRCGVPDEVIFSIITDPDLGISSSVLDKGTGSEKYALRQIERAKEESVDPWLRRLNEQHAVISNIGGKCRVIEEVDDATLHRPRLTRQSFEDFANRYMNQYVIKRNANGEAELEPVGRWWLRHPQRRQYSTIVFAPGRETNGAYNLWKGFACQAVPGDCSLFLEHLSKNICSGNAEHYTYLISWMARCVQCPDSPGQVAIVLRGKQGTGKSFFAKTFGSLFGRHFMQVSDPKHLIGSFNSHLRDVVVLFGDEAFYAGDKKHESVLKTLITEEVITIEAKGIDAEAAPNFTHVILASNSQWVVPAGADERRFFVLDVGEDKKQNIGYFKAIQDQLDKGGREALLHALFHHDLSEFQVRTMPKTAALMDQKLYSMAPEEEWWFRKLCEGRQLPSLDEWGFEVLKQELVDDYILAMRIQNVMRRQNETILGKFLHRIIPGLSAIQKRTKLKVPMGDAGWTKEIVRRAYFWQFPPLDKCREEWTRQYSTDFSSKELQAELGVDKEEPEPF